MASPIPVPEGTLVKRTLHFFWLTDYSGSMSGEKIARLNQAIREVLPELRQAVTAHPEVQIMMRATKFADSASWHVGPPAVSLEQFVWPELPPLQNRHRPGHPYAGRRTDYRKNAGAGYPPVCILVSDGHCTDPPEEYDRAIAELLNLPWGQRAVRLAIAIGDEGDYNEAELLKFVIHQEIGVLKAHNPGELVNYIKWASIATSVGPSQGNSKASSGSQNDAFGPFPTPQTDTNPPIPTLLRGRHERTALCDASGAVSGWGWGCSRQGGARRSDPARMPAPGLVRSALHVDCRCGEAGHGDARMTAANARKPPARVDARILLSTGAATRHRRNEHTLAHFPKLGNAGVRQCDTTHRCKVTRGTMRRSPWSLSLPDTALRCWWLWSFQGLYSLGRSGMVISCSST